jgi:CPA1 family monovalent cation:H+ antiporter
MFLLDLLFEASYHIYLSLVRANFRPILILAFPGVILSSLITGMLVKFTLELPTVEAPMCGVLISATDSVAVTSLLKTLSIDKQLGIILEGENLLNDFVSIVVFRLPVEVAADTRIFGVIESISAFIVTVSGARCNLKGVISSQCPGY